MIETNTKCNYPELDNAPEGLNKVVPRGKQDEIERNHGEIVKNIKARNLLPSVKNSLQKTSKSVLKVIKFSLTLHPYPLSYVTYYTRDSKKSTLLNLSNTRDLTSGIETI